jgi:membrane protein implicated in regulation of membrane protease activity
VVLPVLVVGVLVWFLPWWGWLPGLLLALLAGTALYAVQHWQHRQRYQQRRARRRQPELSRQAHQPDETERLLYELLGIDPPAGGSTAAPPARRRR